MEPVVKKMINVILTVNNNVKSIFVNNKLSFRNINNIEFNNVSFEYSGTKESILNNISFSFFSNKIYALVGKTGSGKSTLLDLAIGAIQPFNGNILANGINISKNITEWRNIVGYVPQDNFLLNDTFGPL